jgi:hypothetical protein
MAVINNQRRKRGESEANSGGISDGCTENEERKGIFVWERKLSSRQRDSWMELEEKSAVSVSFFLLV